MCHGRNNSGLTTLIKKRHGNQSRETQRWESKAFAFKFFLLPMYERKLFSAAENAMSWAPTKSGEFFCWFLEGSTKNLSISSGLMVS